MSWVDLFRYENAIDNFMRLEKEKEKKWLEEQENKEIKTKAKELEARYTAKPLPLPLPGDDNEQPDYGVDAMYNREQYQYNRDMFFKNIKEPDFGKIETVKSIRPKASFGTQLMMVDATPLPKPMKIYKYKAIDQENGAEIVTQQKEIEVYGENEHNYYYLTKDGIQTIAKNECSLQKIDKETLEQMYQSQMNKLAKNIVQSGLGNQTFTAGSELDKVPESNYKGDSTIGKFLAAKGTTQLKMDKAMAKAGRELPGFLQQAGEMGKTAVTAFGDKLSAPLQFITDKIIETSGKTTYANENEYYEPIEIPLKNGVPDKEALKKVDEKAKKVKKIKPIDRVKSTFGSIVEVLDKSLEGQGNLTTAGQMEKLGKKKRGEPLKKEPYKREYNYPKGWSKETDAMMAGKGKEEIAAAREEDKKRLINSVLGRDLNTELDRSEQVGQIAGEMGAMIAEIIVANKISGVTGAKGTLKKVVDAATSGTMIGVMDKLKEKDSTLVDMIRAASKETAFFLTGEWASTKAGKYVFPNAKRLATKGLREGAKSLAFAIGGKAGSIPFEDEKLTLGGTVKEIAYMAAMDMGLKVLTKSPGAIKALKGKKLETKAAEVKTPDVVDETKIAKAIEKKKKLAPIVKSKVEPKLETPKKSRIMTPEEIKQSGVYDIEGLETPKTMKPKAKATTSEFKKKYQLDTPIKGIPKKELAKEANKRYEQLTTDIGDSIIKKYKSDNPRTIFTKYNKKYNLTEGKVSIKKTLSSPNDYARIEWRDGGITILLNPDKPIQQQIAGMRHEIEHQLDKAAGYTVTPGKKTRSVTIADYMSKPGHHQKYKNFEIEYLEKIYNDEMSQGLQKKLSSINKKLTGKTKLTKTKMAQLKEEKLIIQNTLAKRQQMAGFDEGGTFAQSNMSPVNREITTAANLPDYVPPQKSLKERVKDKFEGYYHIWLNNKQGLDKTGKMVKYTSQNYSKHHATAEHVILKEMVGRDGNKIGKSVKDIILAPKGMQDEFEAYLLHLNHMAGMKQGKPVLATPDGKVMSGEAAKKAIAEYERRFPEFKNQVKEVQQFFQDFGQEWLVDGGLITQKEFDSMRFLNRNYVPKQRDIDKGMQAVKGLYLIGAGKGVKRATGGVEKLKPLTQSVPNYVEGVIRAQRRNLVHQELVNTILENPEAMQKYAQIVDVSKMTNKPLKSRLNALLEKGTLDDKVMALSETLIADSSVKGKFAVAFDKGKPILLKINDDSLYKALETMHKSEVSSVDAILDTINEKLSNKVKGAITYYNPLFGIFQAARDIPQAYIAGSNHNPLTYTKNLFKAFSEIIDETLLGGSKDPLTKMYYGLGGPGSNITKVEKSLSKNGWQKTMDTIFSTLNWFGSVTETAPRLAEFRYVMEKGMKQGSYDERLIQEALYKSGDITVNFSRGGSAAKKFDKVAIYTNAGLQGVDKFVRTMITEGVAKGNFAPILKAFGAMTIPSMALHWMNSNIFDGEEYRAIPDYVKDNNYVIPVGDSTYLKIPKNRETAFLFSTTFERMLRYIEGDEDAFKGYFKAARQSIATPVDEYLGLGVLKPISNIVMGGNKDFFGNPIEPQHMVGKRSKRYISTEKTSYMSKMAGPALELIGLSPAQADYLIDSWCGIIGDVYLNFNDKNKELDLWDRVAKITNKTFKNEGQKATSEYYDELDKLTIEINDLEASSGVADYKKQLRDMGYSENQIKEKARQELGGDATYLEELKERRKQLQEDWENRNK